MFFRLSNTSLQWFLLGLLLFFMAGAVGSGLHHSYKALVVREKAHLVDQTRIVSENLNEFLVSTDRMLKIFRDEYLASPSKADARRKLSMRHARIIPGLSSLLIANSKGIVTVSSRPEVLGADISFRDYFKKARSSKDPDLFFISPPFTSIIKTWTIAFSRVIRGKDGSFQGIVIASMDTAYFTTLLRSVNYTSDVFSAMAHSSGMQVLMTPEHKDQPGMDLNKPGSMFYRHMKSGKHISINKGIVHSTGKKRVVAVASVKPDNLNTDTFLVFAVGRDPDLIIQPWYDQVVTETGRFIFVAVALVIFLYLYQKRYRKHHEESMLAEVKVKENARRLEQATLASGLGIWEYNPRTDEVYLDAYMYHLLEIQAGAGKIFSTDELLALIESSDAERIASSFSRVTKDDHELDEEFLFNTGNSIKIFRIKGHRYQEADNSQVLVVGTCEDITEQKYIELQMKKINHGIENSAAAVLITDIKGTIEYVNKKFHSMTGFTKEEIIGQNPRIFKSDSTPQQVYEEMWDTILSGREWKGELLNRRKNGELYWSMTSINPLRDDTENITHFIANIEDINERKNAEMMIEKLAYFDPLTELPNRRLFTDRLNLGIKRSRRQGTLLALFFIDLDRFKNINDSLGHHAGDRLLQEIGERYSEVLREDDIVSRLGGDEFAVILHDLKNGSEAAHVAQNLLDVTKKPVQLEGAEIIPGASIGIAVFPRDAESIVSLEKNADIALYHAKSKGKHTYSYFSEELNQVDENRMHMEEGLRKSHDKGELFLLYQPKIDLSNRNLMGAEALIRWESSEFGMVNPETVITLAEETHMILELGEWIMEQACLQQVAWKEQGCDIQVAVNLSPVQFREPDMVDRIKLLVEKTGIMPERLELELTESVLVEDPPKVAETLRELCVLGCSVAIDDFGTGYSSLNYLKTFPVNVLKIDKSFVMEMDKNSSDRAIVNSIISLASNLDMKTTAEGIELEEHNVILSELGCHFGQGYLFSRPIPAIEIPSFMKA